METITARRKLVFNLGKYEQAETEFTITNIPGTTNPDDISRMLDLLMKPEVDKVVLATAHHPDDNATGVYTWQEIIDKSREDTHA